MTNISEDLKGKTFGKLTVLYRTKYRRASGKFRYLAVCKCECGKEIRTDVGSLKAGRTKSCGCDKSRYQKITGDKSVCFTGYREIRGKTWSSFKERSNRRGHNFSLPIEHAWDLFEKQGQKCALTGLPISFGKWNEETTASLDRIDNSRGYEKDNVQWVHKDVNIMRNVYSIEYFKEICALVVKQSKTPC